MLGARRSSLSPPCEVLELMLARAMPHCNMVRIWLLQEFSEQNGKANQRLPQISDDFVCGNAVPQCQMLFDWSKKIYSHIKKLFRDRNPCRKAAMYA
jgi:hypothetical protein